MGLLHRDCSMPPAEVRKYRQINHMVAVLGPALRELRSGFPALRILDAGCGRSYLTLALAWCFKHIFQHPVEILGVDRNAALVEECRRRTALPELDDVLRYDCGPIAGLDIGGAWRRVFGGVGEDPPVHAIVSLHACDTATDDAIALGVGSGAQLIAVAPCCQAELASKWQGLAEAGQRGQLAPIWSIPHLRQSTASCVTDTMRTLLLRAAGYDATALEFVPSTHTPKNTLIRAMKRRPGDAAALEEYRALKAATGGEGIALEKALGLE
jgi:hypothetical protein